LNINYWNLKIKYKKEDNKMENFNVGDIVTLDNGKSLVEVIEALAADNGKTKFPYIIIKINDKLYHHLSEHYRLATRKEIKKHKIKNLFIK
jgi:hypothetical protein